MVASLIAAFGALEIGLRLFWDGFYVKTPGAYSEPDPVRGWRNRPHTRVAYGEAEFNTVVAHNSFGHRSREIPLERTPGRVRILVLGDSFTYGVGVENHETFSARLEQLDPRLEVINTGVNGYGTAQELLLLRDEGLAFQPDLVLVAFFWNDVVDSYRRRVAAFALRDGSLVYPDPLPPDAVPGPRRTPLRRTLLRHSRVYRFLSDQIKLVRYQVKAALGAPLEDAEPLRPAEREQAWRLTFALLDEIARLAREAGAVPLIAVVPDQVQVEPSTAVIGIEPDDYQVQERVLGFAAARDIPALDLLPGLRAARARGQALYYRLDRHLNPLGHAETAELLHDWIQRLLPPD